MDTQEILALFNKEQRIEIEFPEARKEVLPEVIRFVRPAPGANFINYSQLNEQNADAVIQEQIAYFRPMGQQFNWKVYDQDEPSDLRERLIRHGFEPDEPDAVMVLDLRETPPSLLKPAMVDLGPLQTASSWRMSSAWKNRYGAETLHGCITAWAATWKFQDT